MEYIRLNNETMQRTVSGELEFNPEKDKEAVHAYFLEHVNQNTVFFHSLKEKLNYLVKHNYYDERLLDMYSFDDKKKVYRLVYDKKFRFPSYMSAFKFYNDYALKTNDKEKYLERYEDRIAIVALFLACDVENKDGELKYIKGNPEKALKLADDMINQRFQPATPTFLNAGKKISGEKVSCFILETEDSLNGINMMESTAKQLSKLGGGVGIGLTKTRAKGETLMGIENTTSGVVPIMKSLDQSFRHINQAGQRSGAGVVYLSVFHADINDFLETKKINADEDFRVKTLSIGVLIPDKFYELARDDKPMYIFYPKTVQDEYGIGLDDMNMNEWYDKLVENPNIRKDKINPRILLEKIAILRTESGYPYIINIDNANEVHANNHIAPIKNSNLCVEIFNLSKVSTYRDYGEEDDIGYDISCNLASLNIKNVMTSKFHETVHRAMDALVTVSDSTFIKNAPAVAKANRDLRSVGLGVMNLHGYLASVGIPYESKDAVDFASLFFRTMNYASLVRSNEQAKEKTPYIGFEGSTYHTGEYFEKYLDDDQFLNGISEKVTKLFEGIHVPKQKDWEELAKQVKEHGLYSAYRLAIAPY